MRLLIPFIISTLFLTGCFDEKAEILSYGILDNPIISTELKPDLVAGIRHLIEDWNVIEETTNVKNEFGVDFGIEYIISAPFYKDALIIEEVLIFPKGGLTNPVTKITTEKESEFYEISPNEKQYFSYALEYDWEMQPGDWIFQIKSDDTVLVEKVFYVH